MNKVWTLGLFGLLVLAGCNGTDSSANDAELTHAEAPTTKNVVTSDQEEDCKYLGYGFNIAGGKALYDNDCINLNYPILDLNNEELQSYRKVISGSKVTYESSSSTSTKEISESYSTSFGVGINAKVKVVSADISARFDTSSSFSKVCSEEYSYYSIYAKNRDVVYQIGDDTNFSNYLSSSFKADAAKITDEDSAIDFLEKYGTHMLTGYSLGGIFEMTNYFATSTESALSNRTMSFAAQISATISIVSAGGNASFDTTYSKQENTSESVSNYKCTTYGGDVFPGLTVDQAFQTYSGILGVGITYQIWTDSINEGSNLVMVGMPASSKAIPVWDLLPYDSAYDEAKEYLIAGYVSYCGGEYQTFLEKYPEVAKSVDRTSVDLSPSTEAYELAGVSVYTPWNEAEGNNFSYIASTTNGTTLQLPRGAVVGFDFTNLKRDGQQLVWSSTAPNDITFLDDVGTFRIEPDASTGGKNITIICKTGSVTRFTKTIKINNGYFSGGLGTSDNPYLISTKQDLIDLQNTVSVFPSAYFRQTRDIDLEGSAVIIGNSTNSFTGTYDGNYFTISNLTYGANDLGNGKYVGLFGVNAGTVKNLTLEDVTLKTYTGSTRKAVYMVGSLAGMNNGEITNCHVSDVSFDIDSLGSNVTGAEFNYESVGGFIGRNTGNVTQCSVTTVSISSSAFSTLLTTVETPNPEVSLGGFIGSSRGGTVSGCVSAEIDKLSSVLGTTTSTASDAYTKYVFLGGFFGDARDTDFEYCVVSDLYSITNNVNRAEGNSDDTQIYVGVFGGAVDSSVDCSFSNIIACPSAEPFFTDTSFKNALTGEGNFYANILDVSSFVNEINETGSSNYVSYGTDTTHCINAKYRTISAKGSSSYTSNLAAGTTNYTSLASTNSISEIDWVRSLSSSSDSIVYSGGRVKINKTYVDTIEFDLSGAKTTFLVGETFSTGEIAVYAAVEGKNGTTSDMSSIGDYYVDYSKFVSESPGTYDITVSCYDQSETYQVEVEDLTIVSLKLGDIATDKTFYVGDAITQADLEGVTTEIVYNNGETSTLDLSECTISSETLVYGDNRITVSYGDVENYLYVEAINKEITGVKITNLPNKVNYTTDYTTVTLNGMLLDVTYNSGEVVTDTNPSSSAEILYKPLKTGTNNINLLYGEYTKLTFEVTCNLSAALSAYVTKVSTLDLSDTDIDAMKENIVAVRALEDYLSANELGMNEYLESKQTFDLYVKSYQKIYKNIVDTVGKDW